MQTNLNCQNNLQINFSREKGSFAVWKDQIITIGEQEEPTLPNEG